MVPEERCGGYLEGRGSERGLVVMRLADGEVSYSEEMFRVGLDVGALGRGS